MSDSIGNALTNKKDGAEEALEVRTNAYDEIQTRELKTQWQHKISVIPESEGITTKWWDYTAGVVREGPEAKVSSGEDITTTESGEYNVGDPALAGGAFRVEGIAQDGDAQGGVTIPEFGLALGQTAALWVVPIVATTFNGASLSWGMNF